MPRQCEQCAKPLPKGSRSVRRFCSSTCRNRAWNALNPSRDDRYSTGPTPDRPWDGVRLHHHGGPTGNHLVGEFTRGYWLGPGGCPPECLGIRPPYTGSEPCQPSEVRGRS